MHPASRRSHEELLHDLLQRPQERKKSSSVYEGLQQVWTEECITLTELSVDSVGMLSLSNSSPRAACGACDTRVVKCRLGNDLNRITFFCPRCQHRDKMIELDRSDQTKMDGVRERKPVVDSKSNVSERNVTKKTTGNQPEDVQNIEEKSPTVLQRWLRTGMSTSSSAQASTIFVGSNVSYSSETWSCSACTLLNVGGSNECSVCGTKRKEEEEKQGRASLTLGGDETTEATSSWSCEACTFLNSSNDRQCSMCLTERIVDVVNRKRKADHSPSSEVGRGLDVSASPSETRSLATDPTSSASPKLETVRFKGFKFRRTSLEGTRSADCNDTFPADHVGLVGDDNAGRGVALRTEGEVIGERAENRNMRLATKSDSPAVSTTNGSFLSKKESLNKESNGHIVSPNATNSIAKAKGNPVSKESKENSPSPDTSSRWIPTCRHGRRCDVRMVRKSEENRGRLYFACSVFRNDKCDFFKVSASKGGVVWLKALFDNFLASKQTFLTWSWF